LPSGVNGAFRSLCRLFGDGKLNPSFSGLTPRNPSSEPELIIASSPEPSGCPPERTSKSGSSDGRQRRDGCPIRGAVRQRLVEIAEMGRRPNPPLDKMKAAALDAVAMIKKLNGDLARLHDLVLKLNAK
jgi:hypothetical protein